MGKKASHIIVKLVSEATGYYKTVKRNPRSESLTGRKIFDPVLRKHIKAKEVKKLK